MIPTASRPPIWRTPEELITLGLSHSRVVMMNEAHSGLRRCIRTREIGRRILPVAHAAGVRHLALEALSSRFAADCNHTRQVPAGGLGYLAQPDMRALLQAALDLGWTLMAYEADPGDWPQPQADSRSLEFTNWREYGCWLPKP